MAIHPTAVISADAVIGENVEIGPYAVIEHDVKIGDGCFIDSHAQIGHHTTIGPRCRIYHGALVGIDPQDHRFDPSVPASTTIGADTTLREYVTVHRSPFENGETRVGDHTLLMAFVHIGHDCRIGNYVTIANGTNVAGHVVVQDGVVFSANVLVHQFCRIGALAMIGPTSMVVQDVPPFCMLADGNCIVGANVIGMRRNNMGTDERTAVRHAIRTYFNSGINGTAALKELREGEPLPAVLKFVEFIEQSSRGIMSGAPDNARKKLDEEQEK